MVIAINDISFRKGFLNKQEVISALCEFGKLCLFLKREEVSNVVLERDILNSPEVHKNLEMAPGYLLIDALKDIKNIDEELFRFLISKLAQCGSDEEYGEDEIVMVGLASRHCAFYQNEIFISLASDEAFNKIQMMGLLGEKEVILRNMAYPQQVYTYWEALGFREYEWNPKHGKRVYIRAGGLEVGIAPETDEFGQYLLNRVVEFRKRLFSVDVMKQNRIFEFKQSYGNKYHGFWQNKLTTDDEKHIVKMWMEMWGKIKQ